VAAPIAEPETGTSTDSIDSALLLARSQMRRGLLKEIIEGVLVEERGPFDALVSELAEASSKEVFTGVASKCVHALWSKVPTDSLSLSPIAWENLYSLISKGVERQMIDDNSDQLWVDAIGALHQSEGISVPSETLAPDGSSAFELFRTFTDDLFTRCGFKSFGKRPAVVAPSTDLCHSSVSAAACFNEAAIIRFLHSQGADLLESGGAPQLSPVGIAFWRGNVEAFTALLDSGAVKASSRFARDESGLVYEGDSRYPLIFVLMTSLQHYTGATHSNGVRMVKTALEQDPTAKDLFTLVSDTRRLGQTVRRCGLVQAAILSQNCDVLRASFKAGAVPETRGGTDEEGSALFPDLVAAMEVGTLDMLKTVVEEFGFLGLDYGEEARKCIDDTMVDLLQSYLHNPSTEESKEAFAKVELVTKGGSVRLTPDSALRLLEKQTFVRTTDYDAPSDLASDKLLSLFLDCGVEFSPDNAYCKANGGFGLIHIAALWRSMPALERALALGFSPNSMSVADPEIACVPPFLFCARKGWVAGATRLAEVGALPVFEELDVCRAQPLYSLLGSNFSDNDALRVLRLFKGRTPDMLSPRYYKPAPDGVCEGPLSLCVMTGKLKCLEWLLTDAGIDKASLKEAADHLSTVKTTNAGFVRCPAAQIACEQHAWGALSLLLRHADASVTLQPPGTPAFPVFRHPALRRCPDRALKALVESAARKELEISKAHTDKAASEAKAESAGAATNAFEGPAPKVLTEREEKRKAKKKEAKKKAKARKKASEQGCASGAGRGAGEEDNDSGSSGTDEDEAEMDEEERMLARAPTFDLEKERAARKARADAEAKAASEAGPEAEGKATTTTKR
jgi:hypothetical protein